MSGHSKWAQIKRQKGVADVKKGAAFTKLANAITVAVRESGKDPDMNVRLRLAVDKAKSANMPKDNIERAILRGTGELGDRPIENITYEGYGPGGVAIVAETLTDNRNRTASSMRKLFSEYGGSLGNTNSVLWMFERQGYLEVKLANNRQAIELAAIDAGALDMAEQDDSLIIYTEPAALPKVRQAIYVSGAEIVNTEISLVPKTTVEPPLDLRPKIEELLLTLDDQPDVTNVATNAAL